MQTKNVIVLPYNPEWKNDFEIPIISFARTEPIWYVRAKSNTLYQSTKTGL